MSTLTMDTVPETLVPALPPPAVKPRIGLLPLLLRNHDELNTKLLDSRAMPGIAARLLSVSVFGFALHGAVMGIAAQALQSRLEYLHLSGHPAIWLPIAFVMSLIGALGICLPIFYICSQMAGLDAPLHAIAAQALRGNATGSALLLGLVPFFAALALGCIAGLPVEPIVVMGVGFALPFLSGIAGVRAVYRGFLSLAAQMPADDRVARRRTLLLGMVGCATFIYLLVAPVALYRLVDVLGPHF